MVKVYKTGDIFRRWSEPYIQQYHPPTRVCRVLRAIGQCRTPALGGVMIQCQSCGAQHFIYRSCGNSCCPICPALKREAWLLKRGQELLPGVTYFHLVFTVPHEFNILFLNHGKLLYKLLFKAVWQSYGSLLTEVYGEVEGGMLAVLHTWGQNLSFHPHIHCIVPGAGWDGKAWQGAKSSRFLLDVEDLSQRFKQTFLKLLREAWEFGGIDFRGEARVYEDIEQWRALFEQVGSKNWVVYAKAPAKGAQQVLDYLSRYTHRLAFSEGRILELTDKGVVFQYKDYADEDEKGIPKTKTLELEGVEFIRRFAQHIPPKGFQKIRYYGIWSPAKRQTHLKPIQQALGWEQTLWLSTTLMQYVLMEVLGIDPDVCQHCGSPDIVTVLLAKDKGWLKQQKAQANKSPPTQPLNRESNTPLRQAA